MSGTSHKRVYLGGLAILLVMTALVAVPFYLTNTNRGPLPVLSQATWHDATTCQGNIATADAFKNSKAVLVIQLCSDCDSRKTLVALREIQERTKRYNPPPTLVLSAPRNRHEQLCKDKAQFGISNGRAVFIDESALQSPNKSATILLIDHNWQVRKTYSSFDIPQLLQDATWLTNHS